MTTIACRACGLPLAVETTTCPICGSPDRNIDVHDAITMVDEVATLIDVVEAIHEDGASAGEYRTLAETLQRAADDRLTVSQAADRVGTTGFHRLELWLRDRSGTTQALGTALAAAALFVAVATYLKPDPAPPPTPPAPPPAVYFLNHTEILVELPASPTEEQIRDFVRQELRRLLDEGDGRPVGE